MQSETDYERIRQRGHTRADGDAHGQSFTHIVKADCKRDQPSEFLATRGIHSPTNPLVDIDQPEQTESQSKDENRISSMRCEGQP